MINVNQNSFLIDIFVFCRMKMVNVSASAIAGVSTATIALVISIICLVWILLHVRKVNNGFTAPWKGEFYQGGVY